MAQPNIKMAAPQPIPYAQPNSHFLYGRSSISSKNFTGKIIKAIISKITERKKDRKIIIISGRS